MINSDELLIGFDFDQWYSFGVKESIVTDISPMTNSHILLCGMSGSGKSYAETLLMARIANEREGRIFFADYKQDESFAFLRDCPGYYPYESSMDALDEVYEIMNRRQSGDDTSRSPITLIWDEYMANILSLNGKDKKTATIVMNKVSEILMLGRSHAVRLLVACQRPDASAFPSGSRLNYGIIIILGAAIRSIYEMLIPREYIDRIGDRVFGRGEGIVLLQASEMRFIKIPTVRDEQRLQQVCIDALTRE